MSAASELERGALARDDARRLEALTRRHPLRIVILSPPRCSSTAFARVFWEHTRVRYYAHEPFEVTYYDGAGLDAALDKLERPLDLGRRYDAPARGEGLVIKEMPYQVGPRIDALLRLASAPILFLLRDPRRSIASRRRKKIVGGESPRYPFLESGWRLLRDQIARCEALGREHALVDASDFRARPREVFSEVFARVGLEFSPAQLRWRPCADAVTLDNLEGRHRHLYARVLASDGIQPESERVPTLREFPTEGGVREHVRACLEIYAALRASPALITGAR